MDNTAGNLFLNSDTHFDIHTQNVHVTEVKRWHCWTHLSLGKSIDKSHCHISIRN